MLSKYQMPRNTRREVRTLVGRTRGGKLCPVMAVPFFGSESGSVSQTVTFELDPVAGRMITDITAEIVSVFVPLQAIDAMQRDTADYPGNEDALRALIMSGSAVFNTEPENELTKRMGVVPASYSGVPRVTSAARFAHNIAVNHLRQRKFVDAALVPRSNQSVTPAIIGQTVLDRLNGVLDPEDRVNGSVNLDLGVVNVEGVGIQQTGYSLKTDLAGTVESDGSVRNYSHYVEDHNNNSDIHIQTDANGVPQIRVDMTGTNGAQLSLTDLYQAEKMDRLTREMRKLVDANPQYGQELVSRFAYGLSVDTGRQPFVVYEQTRTFANSMVRAMDGANLDKTQSNLVAQHTFTAPIPRTEFGGILVTFISVKPDETLASQPHPIFSRNWQPFNFVADEMAIDPVPVTMRELNADVASADEETIALYTGLNELYRNYINYGFNRHLDPTTVENKTAIWQLEVPLSVTPETVIYPASLDHYPFQDQLAEVCTYTVSSAALVNTPIIFGPTPVEELAEIETANVFED